MLSQLVNDTLSTEPVEIPSGDEVEAAVGVVLQVGTGNDRGAKTGVNGCVSDEALNC